MGEKAKMALAVFIRQGEQIDYTPSADCSAGHVVVQRDLVGIARTLSFGLQ